MPNLLLLQRLYYWARGLKSEVMVLYYVMKHPATPFVAKCLATLVVGYALSPIDFIPDFIPILGYVDDMLLVPLGIWLVMRMVPSPVVLACREEAKRKVKWAKPRLWLAAAVIVLVWLLLLYQLWRWLR